MSKFIFLCITLMFAISNASGNILVGVASGGAGCWAKGAGTTGKVAGYGIRGMDIGGNVVGAAKNSYDIYENGPSIGNVVGIAGNGLGLAGNIKQACFTEGTQIVVGVEYDENGNFVCYVTANIEDIKVGDLVYSYNTLTGETELAEVTATFVRESDHINYLTIVDENGYEQIIETTDGHPFWVVTDEPDLSRAARSVVDENGTILYHENIEPGLNGFWVEAKDLRVGDVFLGANGELSTLTNVVRVEQSGGIAVFNFSIEGNHNYFVLAKEYDYGQSCILVHNASYSDTISPRDAARIQATADKIQQPIHVVGSRAKGTANPLSDWDYVIEGAKSKPRHTARKYLPRGAAGGEIGGCGIESGIDIFTEPLRPDLPHISFFPK